MELPDGFWEDEFGGTPPDEILDLVSRVSFELRAVMVDPDLWFKEQRVDLVRLILQRLLLQTVSEAIRLDRQAGPSLFSSVPQEVRHEPRVPKPEPPLRSFLARCRNSRYRPRFNLSRYSGP